MDWKVVVAELTSVGLTQAQIAQVCGVSQSTISDLARKDGASCSYVIGARLLALQKRYAARIRAAAEPVKA
jgi:predicted XRE-type DNA-binding protein